jgi:hypothetical protein
MKVVDLAEYRRTRRQPSPRASAPDLGPVYYCRRCGGEHFILRSSGDVHCYGCGARMANVVIDSPRKGGKG